MERRRLEIALVLDKYLVHTRRTGAESQAAFSTSFTPKLCSTLSTVS